MENTTENVKQIFMRKKKIKELSKSSNPTEGDVKIQIETLSAQIEDIKSRFNEEDEKSLEYWESLEYLEEEVLGLEQVNNPSKTN